VQTKIRNVHTCAVELVIENYYFLMLRSLRTSNDYCLSEKEMKEKLRVTRCNSALTLIKTHTSFLRTIRNRLPRDLQILSMV